MPEEHEKTSQETTPASFVCFLRPQGAFVNVVVSFSLSG